jgi:hypothetical protein
MGFDAFINAFKGTAEKASDAVHHDDKKDEKKEEKKDDKKDEKKDNTSANHGTDSTNHGQEAEHAGSSWLGDVYNESIDGLHNIFSSFKGSTDNPNIPKLELNHDTAVDAQGRVLDATGKPTGEVRPKTVASDVTATKPPAAGDPWDYDQWMNLYKGQDQTAKPATPPAETSTVDKVANWVSDKWDKYFGNGKAAQFSTRDENGHFAKTTMSDRGVDHVTEDGTKTHSDGRGTVQVGPDGTKRYAMDGKTGVEFTNGSGEVHNKDGSVDFNREGVKVHVAKDGTVTQEVNGKPVEINKNFIEHQVNGVHVRQHRKGDGGSGRQEEDASKPGEDGKPTVTTVEDKDDHSQMIVINDGKGNTVKLRHNGERIMSSKDNPGVEIVAHKDSDEVRMRADGQEYYLRRQQGSDNQDRWYLYGDKEGKTNPVGWIEGDGSVYKYDANDPSKVGPRIAQVQGLTDSGAISTGTATVGANGEVQMQGTAANVEVTAGNNAKITGPDGTTVVSRTGNEGKGSEVTSCDPKGKCEVTTTQPQEGTYVQKTDVAVNGDGIAVTDANGTPQGGLTVTRSAGFDAQGNEKIEVGMGDINHDGKEDFATATVTPDGVSVESPDGTTIAADGTMRTAQGDCFHPDGSVDFSDGTSIDSKGNVTHYGEPMGSSGGYGSESEGAAVARVNAILGIAASLSSSSSIDPGRIGQLMALYAELGNAQGLAIQSGNMGAFVQADLAKATVAGAISEQQNAAARQEMAKYFTDHPLSNDQLAQLQNQMRGSSPGEVQKFMAQSGWAPDQQQQREPARVQ